MVSKSIPRAWMFTAIVLVVVIAFAGVLLALIPGNLFSSLTGSLTNRGLQPALFQTAPLRTAHGGVDRIYLVSTQSQTVIFRSARSISEARTDYLHVDLWAFDPGTATIAWRKRLRTFKDDERVGRILPGFAILGADGDTLWINVEGPLGVSLADGHVVADVALIEQRNPKLAGKLVLERGYVEFGSNGLQLTLDDASQWRIDARDVSAAPRDTPVSNPAGIVGLADYTSASSHFQIRALTAEQTWLGMLTDAEADELSHPPVIRGRDPNERAGALQQFLNENHVPKPLNDPLPQPYRLWRAHVQQVSAAPPDWPKELPDNWGTRAEFSRYEALPESPIFLRAGLLRQNGSAQVPVWYRNPDSVLVLHSDKLGPSGRLQLTRVSGPLGKPVWQITLPMVALVSVMPGASDLVFCGHEPESSNGREPNGTIEHVKIAQIDVVSGRSRVLDLSEASMTVATEGE